MPGPGQRAGMRIPRELTTGFTHTTGIIRCGLQGETEKKRIVFNRITAFHVLIIQQITPD